jgi:hypothetical protein
MINKKIKTTKLLRTYAFALVKSLKIKSHLNREYIFNWHEEGFVKITLGFRDVCVNGLHQLQNRLLSKLFIRPLQCSKSRASNNRNIVAWKLVE